MHGPFFTRNIVILQDSTGHTGLGEVHGGEAIHHLESYQSLVVGRPISQYRSVVSRLNYGARDTDANNGEGLPQLDLKNLKFVGHAETAVESALLGLPGQFLGVPVAELLGNGQQREEVTMLGYLVGDKSKTDLPYIDGSGSGNRWFRVRRQPAMTVEAILEQAHAAKEDYGFKNFKLKGGVLEGEKGIKSRCPTYVRQRLF